MNFIKIWSMSVAGAVIFGVLCEMLAPDGNMKKYIRIVLGLILIAAVVKPFINASDTDLFAGAISYINELEGVDAVQQESERNMVIRTYKKNLTNEMLLRIKGVSQGCDIDVKTEIEAGNEGTTAEGGDKFGEITDVLVMVKQNAKTDIEKLKKDINKILTTDFGVSEKIIRYYVSNV